MIGVDAYKHPQMRALKTAVSDAGAVADVLGKRYGFNVTVLRNPTRYEILSALAGYFETLGEEDNFLLYYAGHGTLQEGGAVTRGYWQPADAEPGSPANWISSVEITDQLGVLHSIAEGIDISENGQAMGAIREVGPGGHYLGCAHTQANFKTAFWRTGVLDYKPFEQWSQEGGRDSFELAHNRVERMLATFADCGVHDFGILRIMNRYFAETLGPLAPKPLPLKVRRYAGDLASIGKGEILLLS